MGARPAGRAWRPSACNAQTWPNDLSRCDRWKVKKPSSGDDDGVDNVNTTGPPSRFRMRPGAQTFPNFEPEVPRGFRDWRDSGSPVLRLRSGLEGTPEGTHFANGLEGGAQERPTCVAKRHKAPARAQEGTKRPGEQEPLTDVKVYSSLTPIPNRPSYVDDPLPHPSASGSTLPPKGDKVEEPAEREARGICQEVALGAASRPRRTC